MQPQVVDPASRGMCRLPNRCRDLMGFGWPSPYSTYVVPPSLLTRTTGRSKVQKPPASRPAAAPGVATPWFRAPSPARRAASIAACGFYATRHTQCRAGGAAVSCAAGSVCRRGWMSGRPEKKKWTRACTRRDYWTRRRRVWFRLLPSSRFASGGFLRPHDAYVAAARRPSGWATTSEIRLSEIDSDFRAVLS